MIAERTAASRAGRGRGGLQRAGRRRSGVPGVVEAGFTDAWDVAGDPEDRTATFNDWEPPVGVG